MGMDVERCERLNGWLETISLTAEVTWANVEAHGGDPGYYLILASERPDGGEFAPDAVSIRFEDTPMSRTSLAIDVISALGIRALHEAVECVKVDGLSIADPHPAASDYMWEWLTSRVREVVGEYIDAFPGHTDWWVRVTDWNGKEVYDGPSPCPDELCTITVDDMTAGRLYTFDVTPIHFDGVTS